MGVSTTKVSIPQVNATTVSPKDLPRVLNQIQQNIIDGIMRLQQAGFNASTVVGQEITAYLTEDQFQAQAGPGWVLGDGRNIKGSAFAKLFGSDTLPDRRGTVSRMMDNGAGVDPAGDLPLGTYQADAFDSHTHTQDAHAHVVTITKNGNAGASVTGFTVPGSTVNLNSNNDGTPILPSVSSVVATNQASGGSETRAKAIIANVFIRIN